MIINSFMPYVGLITAFGIPALLRWLDRGRTNDLYSTKKTSMAVYRALYSGKEYVIHFKQSGLINIVFVSLMYGIGMPGLFPIAAFNFLNQYIAERIIVSYNVPLPPSLDDRLTKSVISILQYAPLLLLANGYWMISNPEIFDNKWTAIDNST